MSFLFVFLITIVCMSTYMAVMTPTSKDVAIVNTFLWGLNGFFGSIALLVFIHMIKTL